jgi:hypothetical protein
LHETAAKSCGVGVRFFRELVSVKLISKKGADTMSHLCRKWIVLSATVFFVYGSGLIAQAQENLTEQQMRNFLLTAKVIASKQSSKGVTAPYRLTLKDKTMVHDASFQAIDDTKANMQFSNGKSEVNFRDSYKYNIAAYELAKMLGLGDMMPVTVERKWEGKIGSLTWWLPVMMDGEKMQSKHIEPPDPNAWNKQENKMRVFEQLVFDTDRNAGNLLISEKWHLWMIDFSRAFRIQHELKDPKKLLMCDRQLLKYLRQLKASDLEQNIKKYLTKNEINGVMARRDKIVALFDQLIEKKSENAVLYD